MPYQCSSDDGNTPIVTIQKLVDDAESLTWCAECWPVFIANAYAQLFPDDEPIPMTPTAAGPDDDTDEGGEFDWCPFCGKPVHETEQREHIQAHEDSGEIPAETPQPGTAGDSEHDQEPTGASAPAPA